MANRSIRELRILRDQLVKDAQFAVDAAKREGRTMSESEISLVRDHGDQVRSLDAEANVGELVTNTPATDTVVPPPTPGTEPAYDGCGNPYARGQDNSQEEIRSIRKTDGTEIMVLAPCHQLRNLPGVQRSSGRAHIGDWILARATGRVSSELRAMSEGDNLLGGSSVPDQFALSIIDLARNQSVAMRAGCRTIPMTTDRLVMPRIKTDPVMAAKVENASFGGDEVELDMVGITATTRGQVVRCSRELWDDGVGLADSIQTSLAESLAAAIDKLILDAIIANAEAETETGVGAISWEDWLAGYAKVEANNYLPNAFVIAPAINEDLRSLTSGDGTNSAKLFDVGPPAITSLFRGVSNNIVYSSGILGDFKQAVLGVRMNMEIKISEISGDDLEKFRVSIRIAWRGNATCLHGNAFCVFSGITS